MKMRRRLAILALAVASMTLGGGCTFYVYSPGQVCKVTYPTPGPGPHHAGPSQVCWRR